MNELTVCLVPIILMALTVFKTFVAVTSLAYKGMNGNSVVFGHVDRLIVNLYRLLFNALSWFF